MSSIENLPGEAKRLILDYLGRIEMHETKKIDLIRELAEQIEERGWVPPEYISSFLKKILKDLASDRTIEKALGKKQKHKYARYKPLEIRNASVSTSEKEIEVSSSGSESYNEPEEKDNDVPPEQNDEPYGLYEGEPDIPLIDTSAELGLTEITELSKEIAELQTRLKEALQLADDKDKALERERIQNANLEVELGEAKKNEAAALSTSKQEEDDRGPTMEELQIKYDELRAEYAELLEVERLRTSKSDFQVASKTIPTPISQRPWIAAVDAINFYRELNKASIYAIEHNDPWRKIYFDVNNQGQLKAAHFEEPDGGSNNES